jgi:hypothetical protein
MAALITFAIIMGLLVGAVATYFLRVSLAIGREDRAESGSLRSDASSPAARNARGLTAMSCSRWD